MILEKNKKRWNATMLKNRIPGPHTTTFLRTYPRLNFYVQHVDEGGPITTKDKIMFAQRRSNTNVNDL